MAMTKHTCYACGAQLEITEDIERFACRYCGTEWHVRRNDSIVSLKAIEKKFDNIERNTSEISYSNKKIEVSSHQTSENSSILANDVKLRKMKEKKLFLMEEKTQLEGELKSSLHFWSIPVGCVSLIVGFFLSVIIVSILSKFNLYSPSCLSAGLIIGLSFFVSFVVIMLFVQLFYRKKELAIEQLRIKLRELDKKYDAINNEIEKTF